MAEIPAQIIRRFAQKQGIEVTESLLTFCELETFLDGAVETSMSPSRRIDEAWHEFILHTKEYAAFCEKRYGRMIHHIPAPLNCESDPNKRKCGSGFEQSLAECRKCSTDCKSIGVEDA